MRPPRGGANGGGMLFGLLSPKEAQSLNAVREQLPFGRGPNATRSREQLWRALDREHAGALSLPVLERGLLREVKGLDSVLNHCGTGAAEVASNTSKCNGNDNTAQCTNKNPLIGKNNNNNNNNHNNNNQNCNISGKKGLGAGTKKEQQRQLQVIFTHAYNAAKAHTQRIDRAADEERRRREGEGRTEGPMLEDYLARSGHRVGGGGGGGGNHSVSAPASPFAPLRKDGALKELRGRSPAAAPLLPPPINGSATAAPNPLAAPLAASTTVTTCSPFLHHAAPPPPRSISNLSGSRSKQQQQQQGPYPLSSPSALDVRNSPSALATARSPENGPIHLMTADEGEEDDEGDDLGIVRMGGATSPLLRGTALSTPVHEPHPPLHNTAASRSQSQRVLSLGMGPPALSGSGGGATGGVASSRVATSHSLTPATPMIPPPHILSLGGVTSLAGSTYTPAASPRLQMQSRLQNHHPATGAANGTMPLSLAALNSLAAAASSSQAITPATTSAGAAKGGGVFGGLGLAIGIGSSANNNNASCKDYSMLQNTQSCSAATPATTVGGGMTASGWHVSCSNSGTYQASLSAIGGGGSPRWGGGGGGGTAHHHNNNSGAALVQGSNSRFGGVGRANGNGENDEDEEERFFESYRILADDTDDPQQQQQQHRHNHDGEGNAEGSNNNNNNNNNSPNNNRKRISLSAADVAEEAAGCSIPSLPRIRPALQNLNQQGQQSPHHRTTASSMHEGGGGGPTTAPTTALPVVSGGGGGGALSANTSFSASNFISGNATFDNATATGQRGPPVVVGPPNRSVLSPRLSPSQASLANPYLGYDAEPTEIMLKVIGGGDGPANRITTFASAERHTHNSYSHSNSKQQQQQWGGGGGGGSGSPLASLASSAANSPFAERMKMGVGGLGGQQSNRQSPAPSSDALFRRVSPTASPQASAPLHLGGGSRTPTTLFLGASDTKGRPPPSRSHSPFIGGPQSNNNNNINNNNMMMNGGGRSPHLLSLGFGLLNGGMGMGMNNAGAAMGMGMSLDDGGDAASLAAYHPSSQQRAARRERSNFLRRDEFRLFLLCLADALDLHLTFTAIFILELEGLLPGRRRRKSSVNPPSATTTAASAPPHPLPALGGSGGGEERKKSKKKATSSKPVLAIAALAGNGAGEGSCRRRGNETPIVAGSGGSAHHAEAMASNRVKPEALLLALPLFRDWGLSCLDSEDGTSNGIRRKKGGGGIGIGAKSEVPTAAPVSLVSADSGGKIKEGQQEGGGKEIRKERGGVEEEEARLRRIFAMQLDLHGQGFVLFRDLADWAIQNHITDSL